MQNVLSHALRASICGAALTASILATPASAQSTVQPPQTPLSDTDCNDYNSGVNAQVSVPPCTVQGTRNVAILTETVTPDAGSGGFFSRVTGEYGVTFDGTLQVDGIPVGSFPFGGAFLVDASNVFGTLASSFVDISTTYTGYHFDRFLPSSVVANGQYANFDFYDNFNTSVSRIGVDVQGGSATDANTGQAYTYDLSAINPTAISANNTVALSGRYNSENANGGLVFGTLGGTAGLLQGQIYTTADSFFFGGNNDQAGFISPFGLEYNVTAVETTRLDETGLVTPTISVTSGINMNGSTLANLANGVAPGDAVNKAQLDSEALARATADTALGTAIAAETAARTSADTALATSISNETAARTAGDAALAASVASETAARTAADAVLATSIASETASRTAADNVLAASITDETTARVAGDTALAATVTSETAARTAADTALGNSITSEASTRSAADTALAAADTVLDTKIATEATVRASADAQITQRLNTLETGNSGASILAESNARMAADLALSNRLDGFQGRLDQIDSRLDSLDKKVASSTAVAVALSGNAFLPDTKFNLTANVGAYDGAQAGALQIGALITQNVAVNAGVATGFNRGGKTAGRVGVTLGW